MVAAFREFTAACMRLAALCSVGLAVSRRARIGSLTIHLLGTLLFQGTFLQSKIAGAAGAGAGAGEKSRAVMIAPHVRLERILFEQNLLPDEENSGFGALLYGADGTVAMHAGHKAWLYTTGLSSPPPRGRRNWYGKWISYVRELDLRTLASGPSRVALDLSGEDRWAVVHDVIQVGPMLFVAFYSANGGVRAAVSNRADSPFVPIRDFNLDVTDAWERQGGKEQSLESNGAHILIDENEAAATLWLGYDSYHVDRTAGQLGWAKIRIDKKSRDVQLLGKYPGNPLPMLPDGYIAARCGGNLASDVRLGGERAFFYYSRPDTRKIMLTVALSPDPLFGRVSRIVELEPPLGDEKVIEKFEAYMLDDELHIIYENELSSGRWGTGMRVYKIED
jgi:hypothetical protein